MKLLAYRCEGEGGGVVPKAVAHRFFNEDKDGKPVACLEIILTLVEPSCERAADGKTVCYEDIVSFAAPADMICRLAVQMLVQADEAEAKLAEILRKAKETA